MNSALSIVLVNILSICLNSCISRNYDLVQDYALDTTYSGLPILHLNGTPYENGVYHGRIMKSRISTLVALWKKDIESHYQIPADRFIKMFIDSTDYINTIKKWTPELLEEIKGISVGSGIDFNTIFAFQLVDEIWTNARLINIPHHCTSVGVNNYKKDSSANYIAQNIDITPFYHGFEILLDIKDVDTDSRTLVTSFAGYIGANGLNKHIGITENTLSDLKSSLDGLPVCCIARKVLTISSFEEAVNFIKKVKHASGQNYILGSRHDIISLECASDLVTEYWPDSAKTFTYHTNRPLVNKSYHPTYFDHLKLLYGEIPESISFSDERLKSLQGKIPANKFISLEIIKDALSENPVCNSNTFASTIMEFNNDYNQLMISPGRPDSVKYLEFRILK